MHTASAVAVHSPHEAVHDPLAPTDEDCTVFSGAEYGPHLLPPADTLVGARVPRACLQLWAGIDSADVQTAAAAFRPLTRNELRISLVRELINELTSCIFELETLLRRHWRQQRCQAQVIIHVAGAAWRAAAAL